jgi:gamma-glutamylputrescine oxidase
VGHGSKGLRLIEVVLWCTFVFPGTPTKEPPEVSRMSISRRNLLLGAGASVVAAPGLAGLALNKSGIESPEIRSGGNSLWSDEIPSLPAQPEYKGARTVDLAIVGGGYTGLSCAYYAKRLRPDWNVVVLESHTIGSGASSRHSGAVYAKYVGIDDTEMPVRGLNRLRDFLEQEEVDCDFRPASTLTMCHSTGSAKSARDNLHPGAKWVSPEELRDIGGTRYYAGAVDSPGYFKVQPAKMVAGHAEAALRVGAEIYENSPAINIKSGKPATITTPQGRLTAKNVCIATNGYTPRLGLLEYKMFPLHQYTFATRQLSNDEIRGLGLDRWDLRFEPRTLPITFSLSPSGHFFLRIVLGYASYDSTEWQDKTGAQDLVRRMFQQRYPQIADIGLVHGWHGVTGQTALMKPIAGPVCDGNIHVSVAYNGLGAMPAHNNGYLTACRITGNDDQDIRFLSGVDGQVPMPGDFYRSLMLKPFMTLLQPV